jgi:hypothetical protein
VGKDFQILGGNIGHVAKVYDAEGRRKRTKRRQWAERSRYSADTDWCDSGAGTRIEALSSDNMPLTDHPGGQQVASWHASATEK